jgi:hypothetical protein
MISVGQAAHSGVVCPRLMSGMSSFELISDHLDPIRVRDLNVRELLVKLQLS